MRNGNRSLVSFYTVLPQGSYPTYEEWKRFIKTYLTTYLFVLILPMRNGNEHMKDTSKETLKFLSYLWGMETSLIYQWFYRTSAGSYPTYEEWKLSYCWTCIWWNKIVLILPMRNGNSSCPPNAWYINFVLILPMRNGNFSICQ